MTIEKHGNKWRIRQKVDGHLYLITLDHKPSQSEAIRLLAKQYDHAPASAADRTFEEAARDYISSKSMILSPATIRGYNNILKVLPDTLKFAHLGRLTNIMVQSVVNEISALKSAKTVKNHASFIMAVLRSADMDIKQPRLPQREKKTPYIPSEEDVRAIFAAVKGTDYEIPYALAALGLRRSEICALTPADLEGSVLHITKAVVMNEHDEYVIKGTKTADSTRDVMIPEALADQIRKQGYIYKGKPQSLTKHLYILLEKLGMPRFSIHKLRHFFASYMHQQGFTDKQIQEAGGWHTDHIMKTVYQHAMDVDAAKQRMAGHIEGLF